MPIREKWVAVSRFLLLLLLFEIGNIWTATVSTNTTTVTDNNQPINREKEPDGSANAVEKRATNIPYAH